MKKFTTKRGFTMVEVLVAFVIFAIMAAMVSAILSSTMKAKQGNIELEQEIFDQQTAYYIDSNLSNRQYEPDSTKATIEEMNLDFGDEIGDIKINYNVVDPNAAGGDNTLSLEYIVGNVDYKYLTLGVNEDESKEQKPTQGSVTTRMDARIYGTTKLDDLKLEIKKDLSYTDGHRYFISLDVDSSYSNDDKKVEDVFKYFVQARLNFTTDNEVIDCGYVDYTGGKFGNAAGNWLSGMGTVEIIPTSPYSVRIGGLQTKGSSLEQITHNKGTAIYVTLKNPIPETVSSKATISDTTNKELGEQMTSLVAKEISNYIISTDADHAAALNIKEAREWLTTLRAQKTSLENVIIKTSPSSANYAVLIEEYNNKLEAINTEINTVKTALDGIELMLNANLIFGYSGAAAAEAGTEIFATSGIGESVTETSKYQFGEYITDYSDSTDEDGKEIKIPIYQPGVLGGFPIDEPETTETSESSETAETSES